MDAFEIYEKCYYDPSSWDESGLLSNLATEQKPQIIELYTGLKPYFDKKEKYFEYYLPILNRIYVELVNSNIINNSESKMLVYLLIDVDEVVKRTNLAFDNVFSVLNKYFKNTQNEMELCRLISNNYKSELTKDINPNTIKERLRQLNRDRKIDKIIKN
jgi:hypothetical protein